MISPVLALFQRLTPIGYRYALSRTPQTALVKVNRWLGFGYWLGLVYSTRAIYTIAIHTPSELLWALPAGLVFTWTWTWAFGWGRARTSYVSSLFPDGVPEDWTKSGARRVWEFELIHMLGGAQARAELQAKTLGEDTRQEACTAPKAIGRL